MHAKWGTAEAGLRRGAVATAPSREKSSLSLTALGLWRTDDVPAPKLRAAQAEPHAEQKHTVERRPGLQAGDAIRRPQHFGAAAPAS